MKFQSNYAGELMSEKRQFFAKLSSIFFLQSNILTTAKPPKKFA